MSFFDFHVQFGVQNQKPENPHEIKENEETSFVVQTQGVQIAKDVSDGRGRKIRTLKNGFGDRYVTITSCPFGSTNVL